MSIVAFKNIFDGTALAVSNCKYRQYEKRWLQYSPTTSRSGSFPGCFDSSNSQNNDIHDMTTYWLGQPFEGLPELKVQPKYFLQDTSQSPLLLLLKKNIKKIFNHSHEQEKIVRFL